MSSEVAHGENSPHPLPTSLQSRNKELEAENEKLSLQLRIKELEAENANLSLQLRIKELEAVNSELSFRLSNCTCSEKKKKRRSSAESDGSKSKQKKSKGKTSGAEMARFTCNLPEELLLEILSQLPPKSLMRLKCTSKSWYVFINNVVMDPTFVAKHLDNSMSSKYTLFSGNHYCCCKVTTPKCDEPVFSLLNVLRDDNVDDQIHFVTEDLSLLLIPEKNYLSESIQRYHCNGIFCLFDSWHNALTLCNPATKEFKLLPRPSHVFNGGGVGFGYDSRANEYKVVIFGSDHSKHFRAELYSLNTHSWREISFGLDVSSRYHSTSLYLKGIFYWYGRGSEIILSFDMCNEVFHSISMPGDGFLSAFTCLTVWNESVAVIYSPSYDNDGDVVSNEIWVMDNSYNSIKGNCSWNKCFSIPLLGSSMPLAFMNDDELLIKNEVDVLCSYNIRSQKLREIDIYEVDDVQYWSFSYVMSLVSVQGRE